MLNVKYHYSKSKRFLDILCLISNDSMSFDVYEVGVKPNKALIRFANVVFLKSFLAEYRFGGGIDKFGLCTTR